MTRSPREIAAQKVQQRKQQEQLFKDLLGVVDNLEHACVHWRQAALEQQQLLTSQLTSSPPAIRSSQPDPWWSRLRRWVAHYYATRPGSSKDPFAPWVEDTVPGSLEKITSTADAQTTPTLSEVVVSARDGVEMIQTSMLEVLKKHQIVPIKAQGQLFDPAKMYALGQRVDNAIPANTVVEEVVKGYLWKDRVLREAQVVVSVPSPEDPEEK